MARTPSLINRAQIRKLALDTAARRFEGIPGYKFDRVAESFLDGVESDLRARVETHVRRHPTLGQTIR